MARKKKKEDSSGQDKDVNVVEVPKMGRRDMPRQQKDVDSGYESHNKFSKFKKKTQGEL